MKSVIISIIACLFTGYVFAGNYETAMKSNISEMYKSHEPEKLERIASRFFRIGAAEQNKWLPYYYAAYSYMSITFDMDDADKKDPYLDKGQEMLDKAMELEPDESELYVLQGLLYSLRVTNMARGMKYSSLTNENLEKAKELNPQNPRIWFCKAKTVHHTPSMFGGGAEKALPHYKKAKKLFESFEAPNPFWPSWGKEETAKQIKKITE